MACRTRWRFRQETKSDIDPASLVKFVWSCGAAGKSMPGDHLVMHRCPCPRNSLGCGSTCSRAPDEARAREWVSCHFFALHARLRRSAQRTSFDSTPSSPKNVGRSLLSCSEKLYMIFLRVSIAFTASQFPTPAQQSTASEEGHRGPSSELLWLQVGLWAPGIDLKRAITLSNRPLLKTYRAQRRDHCHSGGARRKSQLRGWLAQ